MRQFPQGTQSSNVRIDRQASEIDSIRLSMKPSTARMTPTEPKQALQWLHRTEEGRRAIDGQNFTQ